MMQLWKRFANNERGATAVEYGLIAALIAMVIIVGAKNLGSQNNNTFSNVANKVKTP